MTARSAMTTPGMLKPGFAPARLLLRLWAAQARGERTLHLSRTDARHRLVELGLLVCVDAEHYTLTQAGRLAARALEAGSR